MAEISGDDTEIEHGFSFDEKVDGDWDGSVMCVAAQEIRRKMRGLERSEAFLLYFYGRQNNTMFNIYSRIERDEGGGEMRQSAMWRE